MGLKPFPGDCSLWIMVREGKEVSRLTFTPVSERKGNFHVHKFPLPGIGFTLLVSKNLPANFREMCLVHGVGKPIIATSLIEPILADTAFKMLSRIPSEKRPSLVTQDARVSPARSTESVNGKQSIKD